MLRRVENLHRRGGRRRLAAERQADVVDAGHVDVFRREAVVEAALELMTAAGELRQVVLPVGNHLHAAAEHHLGRRAVAVGDARRRVGDRLEIGLLVEREVGVVVAGLGVEEHPVAEHPVVRELGDHERVELFRRRLLRDVDRGEPIRLVVPLFREVALEPVGRPELVGDLALPRQDVGRVLIAAVEQRRRDIVRRDRREARHLHVRGLVVGRTEEEHLVAQDRPADLEVGIRQQLRGIGVGPEAGIEQGRIHVVGLGGVALIGLQRLALELVRAGLGDHVDEHPAGADRDVLRAGRHLDVLECARHVVVHREPLRRRVVDVDPVEHLGVLAVRRAARGHRTLQSALVAAHVGRVDHDARRLVFEDVPDVLAAGCGFEQGAVDVGAGPDRPGVDDRRLPFHGNRLRQRADLHRHVDAGGLALAQDDVLADVGLKPLQRHLDGVGRRIEAGDLEHAAGVGSAFDGTRQDGTGDGDGGAGHDRALAVDHADR